VRASSQRRALALLFSALALAFTGVALGAAWGAGSDAGRWIVAAAAVAIAVWLASLAWGLARPRRRAT
jgi:hypothetical protein